MGVILRVSSPHQASGFGYQASAKQRLLKPESWSPKAGARKLEPEAQILHRSAAQPS